MANSYVVSSLPDYVEQRREELIAKSVMGAKTLDYINLQTGVKGPTALNLIDFDITVQDDACGWNEEGVATLTQRIIDAKPLRVNMAVCDKNLYGKWAQYQVKVAAGKVASDLPFEKEFTDGVLNGIQERLEELIWQGDANNAGEFDGFLTILGSATSATGTTKMDLISEAYAALPCAVAGKSDVVVFVSCATFRAWMQELVAANLYHYNPGNTSEMVYELPGTNVKVIAVPGMADDAAVAGRLSNFYYGTDLESDAETFDLWYSKDNREFRIDVSWIAGVQIAYPSEVAYYSL